MVKPLDPKMVLLTIISCVSIPYNSSISCVTLIPLYQTLTTLLVQGLCSVWTYKEIQETALAYYGYVV